MTTFSLNRRDFLRRASVAGVAAGAGALFANFRLVNTALAESTCPAPNGSDYKALVCVFLLGGNDSYNWLVPTDDMRHAEYARARGAMALGRDSLLPISPRDTQGRYGLHPNCPELARAFEAGHAAFVVNSGTLVRPTRKSDYLSGRHPLPPQLFSHSDQQAQWQDGRPFGNGTSGWGGLAADRLHLLDAEAKLPLSMSLSGNNRFQTGRVVQPYSITSNGPTALVGYEGAAHAAQRAALLELLDAAHPDPLTRSYARTFRHALDYHDALAGSLDGAAPLATEFPQGHLGESLKMIARVIGLRAKLGMRRQIFFVAMGGFDTHDHMLEDQPDLLGEVSKALGAFHQSTFELGVQDQVTAFTMSEFARTLNTDGDGTDHAWGGHQFVIGGAVRGRRLYGTPGANGQIFPDLHLDGADSLPRGQMIPTTSSDQYSATLARWMGLSECDLDTIFPTLRSFDRRDLGFMA